MCVGTDELKRAKQLYDLCIMETTLLPNETAVIVLDIQNDFCSSDGAFQKVLGRDPSAIQKMVKRLAGFIEDARNAGCKIIFSKMINGEDSPANLRERLTSGMESKANEWPFGLERGSWGSELYQLKPQGDDVIIEKLYFDFFSSPELKQKLESYGIQNVIICGVYMEMCVLATASRGFSEGYRVVIPEDLTETAPENQHLKKPVAELLAGYIAEVVASREIITKLKSDCARFSKDRPC